MSGAGEALESAAAAAVRATGLAVFTGPPVQASEPYAVVEIGPVADWGHKSNAGREVRLSVTLWVRGERPAALHGLMDAAEGALAGLGAAEGWQLVSLQLVRSRTVPPRNASPEARWAGVLDYRARMLRA
jgi:hypothetical protein